mgnify:CR=1 FL=1
MTTFIYLLIRSLNIQGANALNGNLGMGYPAMTAFHGFVRDAARSIAGREDVAATGFILVHHDARPRLYGRYNNRPTQKRSIYTEQRDPGSGRQGYYITPPGETKPQVDLQVSLVIQIEGQPDALADLTDAERQRALPPRALGGVVEGCDAVHTDGDPINLLQGLRRDYVVLDRTKMLHQDDERDALTTMLDLLSPDAAHERRLMPSQVGHLAISGTSAARNYRDGRVPHVFTEPVTGLVEFQPLWQALQLKTAKPITWSVIQDQARGFHGVSAPSADLTPAIKEENP